MARNFNRFFITLTIGSIGAIATAACGGDDEPSGGTGGTGGAGATGGGGMGGGGMGGSTTGGTGGSTTGGTGGAPDGGAADPYTCFANYTPPGGTTAAGADCCEGLGTCTATGDLSGDDFASNYGLDTCDNSASLVCAPKPNNELPDGGATPSCTIDLGGTNYEGRCIPACFVLGTPGASNLNAGTCPTDIVAADVVCAPCYSPLDGSETGACSRQPGDSPSAEGGAPEPFAECGVYGDAGGPATGLCVPTALVEESGVGQATLDLLPQDSCAADELCVPKKKVENISECFVKCESAVGPGACVPTYIVATIPDAATALSILGQGTCEAGETCAPCLNPLQGNAPSGACEN